MQRSTLVRGSIFLATVVAAWAVLSLGSGGGSDDLVAGALAPQDFEAGRTATIVDEAATEEDRQAAREAVPPPRQANAEVEATVTGNVQAVFEDLTALAIGDPPTGPGDEIPELPAAEEPTSTTAGEGSTTTTASTRGGHGRGGPLSRHRR